MKINFLKKMTAIITLVIFPLFTSCSNDDDQGTPVQEQSIAQIASANNDLSILVQALSRANLVTVLDAPGDYTVFAPTNAAFSAFLQANGFATVNDVPVDLLREVLLNHVIAMELESDELTTGYVKTLAKGAASSSNTLSMYVDTSNGVTLNGGETNNGAKVTMADIDASNGVIHLVNNVIGLPTIVNHAIANPNFSILVQALTRNDQPDFAGILSGTSASPFTVFAPVNPAFVDLLTELNLASLDDVPQATLENTLKYHVVTTTNALSSDLSNGMNISSFQGGSFTVNIGNSVTITDANNRTANVIAVDVQAANGVIHALDRVILPNL